MRVILRFSKDLMPPAEEMALPSNAAETDEGCSMVASEEKQENHENWRNDARGLRRINAYALRNKVLTDVTFSVGPEAKEIHAHRTILALGSPVFEAMFFGGLPEKGNIIAIPDVTPEGFQCLLTYLYTESHSFQHENEAFEACVAADKYCVPYLKEECEQYICMSQLSPDKVWSFLDHSLLLNLKGVTEKCLTFIQSHTKLSLQASSFLEASKEAVEHVLTVDTLEVNELELLKSIVLWAEAKTVGEKNPEEVLIPLIRHIRFGTLRPKDFCGFLDKNGRYLNDSDSLAILKHLIEPSSFSLPDWCCTKSWRILHTHECNSSECCKDNNDRRPNVSRHRSRSRNRSRSRSRSRSVSRCSRHRKLNKLINRSRSPRNRTQINVVNLSDSAHSDFLESSSDSSSSLSSDSDSSSDDTYESN